VTPCSSAILRFFKNRVVNLNVKYLREFRKIGQKIASLYCHRVGSAMEGHGGRRGMRSQVSGGSISALTATEQDFDQLTTDRFSDFLERATGQTRQFLRETGNWTGDIGHEKLARRWAYELVEQFLASGRTEVPCRPFLLLDSVIAKHFSQSEPLCFHHEPFLPLGQFLDGLTARAVVCRDALMALFYHLYGLGQGQVVRLLGLGPAESQRVYKNFERWRRTGWDRAVAEIGMSETGLRQLEKQKAEAPGKFNHEALQVLKMVQRHYRKSEPTEFPCLSRDEWAELFEQGCGYDYRVWHLALCCDCFFTVWSLRETGLPSPMLELDVQLRPREGGRLGSYVLQQGHKKDEHGWRQPGVADGRPRLRRSRKADKAPVLLSA
jgi:hypothetical protein